MVFMRGELRRALGKVGWRSISVLTKDFVVRGLPRSFVKPIVAVEPALEATALTGWLGQSHFISARS